VLEKFGYVLIFVGLAAALWRVKIWRENIWASVVVYSLFIFVGIFLIMQDRIVEVTVSHLGAFKTLAKEATVEVDQIKQLRRDMEAGIDSVAREATQVRQLYEELANKTELADRELHSIRNAQQEASTILSELQEVTEFNEAVVVAQNDDRRAFDRLKAWGQ